MLLITRMEFIDLLRYFGALLLVGHGRRRRPARTPLRRARHRQSVADNVWRLSNTDGGAQDMSHAGVFIEPAGRWSVPTISVSTIARRLSADALAMPGTPKRRASRPAPPTMARTRSQRAEVTEQINEFHARD